MAYVKLVHAGHFPCHVRHHVLTVFERSDIMSDKVSHIKQAHARHFRFHVRHVPCGMHIGEHWYWIHSACLSVCLSAMICSTLCPRHWCNSSSLTYLNYLWGIGVHGDVNLPPWPLTLEVWRHDLEIMKKKLEIMGKKPCGTCCGKSIDVMASIGLWTTPEG